ncbi:MAG: PorV/PorQ family protein, partial [Elusimicrobiota bacterium]
LAASSGNAQDLSRRAVGTAGSAFLSIDVDPRGIAMGGAYTSVVRDAYSMYWNPAGLSQIHRAAAAAMHNEYLAGIRFQYFAGAKRISDTSVMGMAVRYMDAGNIVNRDISGNRIGSFRPRSYVYEVGWGQQINDLSDAERDVSMGVTGRWAHTDMIARADAFALDIGIQIHYTESYSPYNFGIVLQNIGRGQKFDAVRDNLPFTARVGTSVWPQPYLLLTLDGVLPIDNMPYAAFGTELKMEGPNDTNVYLRGGYNMRNQFNNLEGIRGFTVGTGLKAVNFRFDYAFVPFGILGNVHRFSVAWELPPKRSRRFRRR